MLIQVQLGEKVKCYSQNWSTNIFNRMENLEFQEQFRMDKQKFLSLMDILYPLTRRISRNLFKIRVLMFLSFIGQDETYRSLREQYGIPLTTITRYTYYISNFLVSMSHEFIKLPSPAEYESISR